MLLVLTSALLAACAAQPSGTPFPSSTRGTSEHERGRLGARPSPPRAPAPPAGLHPLGLATGRDGLLYVPPGLRPDRSAPLVVSLHGAGGNAQQAVDLLRPLADEHGLVVLAPESRASTWDALLGHYGPDVAHLDRSLAHTFERLHVDPGRLAIAGFSDGASYALCLGLANGDLFGDVLAFSPGFSAPPLRRGSPRVFVSHGTGDRVLPIGATSRRLVPRLRGEGYDVRYHEFDGDHTVPPAVSREAVTRFLSAPRPG